MWFKENDTYIGKYWKNSEIIPIRKELLAEWCIENLSIFFAEQVFEKISHKAMCGIWIGQENEKFIQESLQHIWRKLTPNIIEQYTWWVPCVEREKLISWMNMRITMISIMHSWSRQRSVYKNSNNSEIEIFHEMLRISSIEEDMRSTIPIFSIKWIKSSQ